jgi:F420-dependent oxidoreductase-like protein
MTKLAVQLEPQWGFSYADVAAVAAAAEAHGFDALWVSDHLLWDGDAVERDCYEAWSLLAALAPVTQRLRLGTLVTCNSYRHPALLAKTVAGLDALSGGRIDFGVGAGWKDVEYKAYGYPFPGIRTRQDQMVEAIELSRLLWSEPKATYTGVHYRLDAAVCAPKPVQRPLPVWIGGHGDRLLELISRHGDGWNMVFGRPLDALADRHRALDRACESIGRDPASVARSVFLFCAVLEEGETADALIDDQVAKLGPMGRMFVRSGQTVGLVGSADQVAENLRAHLALGFGGLHLLFAYGHEQDQIARVAEQVRPLLG